jgi:hypothetical protein
MFILKIALVVVSLLMVPRAAMAQTVFAYPGAKAQFDIVAADLATAVSYTYRTYTDAQTVGVVLAAVCTGTVSPFTCLAPFPVQTPGAHSITATAQNVTAESAKSTALVFTWTNNPPPNAPSVIRIAMLLDVFPETAVLNVREPNDPHANTRHLVVQTWPVRMVGNAVILRFAFPVLPLTTTVESATLLLTLDESDDLGTNQYRVSAHKLLRAVDIETATGFQSATDTPWTASGCCAGTIPMAQGDITTAYDAINVGIGQAQAKAWDLTAMVQEWIADPARNFGLLLNPDLTKLGDRFRSFAGLSAPDVRDWPYLRVALVV